MRGKGLWRDRMRKERDGNMVGISCPRTKKEVVLRGSVIETKTGCFVLKPVFGSEITVFASKCVEDELSELLNGAPDDARILVKGIGVYRHNELEYLMQVDYISLLHPRDVPARLDEFRDMKDGWADGMQRASDWGSGYGKAPSHEGLDWLADKFTSEYPNDLPLPYTYPTPEGGIQMEWSIGAFEAEIEIDLNDHAGDWFWFERTSEDEGQRFLNLDDSDSWAGLAADIRNLRKDD